ncbi:MULTISPECIES: methanogenesis marker 2 protein [unclassified Methanoculleus]|uniref:methanogenesis marker 2 protein n=1 Tax=unclassified Methanoculleus TaxID=2619537 RepID=UPI0025D73000|nr:MULTISPECIES: methanogenesis marker 2 protein [unclassified Methanoculleus]MCK9316989.1 methanogenesis marker 2 protein [Methanoculleus sp.]MDD2252863.1 methanogenesis marker 2 protein [Methanoculleus sp.]MDD2787235.1 methanogenesis marker 2 protein [Methanoculleus sp.]MDD3215720.1 methanogenesis marker 2 protein [Methanoculleus sp.]MDD4313521.1 methanogenesis marker 2 protein [Methanoculleus sp.]
MVKDCSTDTVARAVREYEGVTRKRVIGDMIRSLRVESPDVVASFGEDAAVIRHNSEDALLLAADGIWSRLMEADPFWAGYCAVLVNVHDIAAMGGRPVAMVDILSVTNDVIRDEVTRGMVAASTQFGVPIVGGHLHPETPYSVVDVAILGTAQMDQIIFSDTAEEGDRVVAAIDLNGRVHPSCSFNWDSVTMKSAEEVRAQIRVMEDLGKEHLVTAGKDISNPGVIGTLGMLLEVSGKGAVIDLEAIPRPDLSAIGLPFEQWVRMYPGMGFILTVKEENVQEVCRRFTDVGIAAAPIGEVDGSRRLSVRYLGRETQVFDLDHNGIMQIFIEGEACR